MSWKRLLNRLRRRSITAPVRVLVLGDSNTARPQDPRRRWTTLLEAISGGSIQTVCEACDGRTTVFDKAELNGLAVIENCLTDNTAFDCFVMMLGTNDIKSCYGPPTTSQIAEGAHRIFTAVRGRHPHIRSLLVTPPPLGGISSGDFVDAHTRIQALARAYQQYAAHQDVELVHVTPLLDPRRDLEPDQVHINQRGRKKIAAAVYRQLATPWRSSSRTK